LKTSPIHDSESLEFRLLSGQESPRHLPLEETLSGGFRGAKSPQDDILLSVMTKALGVDIIGLHGSQTQDRNHCRSLDKIRRREVYCVMGEVASRKMSSCSHLDVRQINKTPPPSMSTRLSLSGETSPLCCENYRNKQYTVKHNSISDFIKVYFLHCFAQRHVSALVMSHLQIVYFS
jgi:hypothetical protein